MSVVSAAEVKTTEEIPGIKERVLMDESHGTVAATLGEMFMDPGSYLPAHTHPVEEVFYVFEGSGIAVVGQAEHRVSAGMAILAPAEVPHAFRNDTNALLKVIWMHPAQNPSTTFVEG